MPHVGQALYDGFTLVDVYDMDEQERFEFFKENEEIAFNMWQDLIENITIQDEEFYDEIDYYEDYEEYDETTSFINEGRLLQ